MRVRTPGSRPPPGPADSRPEDRFRGGGGPRRGRGEDHTRLAAALLL